MRQAWRERGDTLIEVTLALAILALVLSATLAAANHAYALGQNAKERSQMVSDAQQQAEALESFRDSYRWAQFVAGNATVSLPGINVRGTSADCDPNQSGTQRCFHMVQQTISGLNQWVPAVGPGTGTQIGGLGYVRIIIDGDPGVAAPAPTAYTFVIQYGVPARGGGPDLASSLRLKLVDLDSLRP
ncbi:MAG TPA: prepilin-type N-terminal cleavage/methylation domain-containing protein [Candidatus Saccharimonas sp.]|nr:prepilin-type N-terminal cleavage/methylation domain-containing protein [Candidatus Saccharimonas sp.]